MAAVGIPPIFLLLVAMTSACLITNCPRGGKRNGARPPPRSTTEELPFCTSCGPAELGGLCFGPTMCCSPVGGCEFGGPNAATCLGIRTIPPLCRIPPQNVPHSRSAPAPAPAPFETRTRCGAGICTTEGLCCTTDWCQADERCTSSSEPSSNVNNLIVPDHNISPSLRQDSQETAFKDWHS